MRKLAFLTLVAVALLIAPPVALCDDLDDLKAAHEQFYKALNSLDADGAVAVLHEEFAGYLPNNPFPFRKPTTEILNEIWAAVERSANRMINPQYVLVGNTGIIWGHVRGVLKPKDGPAQTRYSRVTYTYVNSGGKWLLLSVHGSRIPSGD